MATIFNEMQDKANMVRGPYVQVEDWLKTLKKKDVERGTREAESRFRRQGITFAVYGDDEVSMPPCDQSMVPCRRQPVLPHQPRRQQPEYRLRPHPCWPSSL